MYYAIRKYDMCITFYLNPILTQNNCIISVCKMNFNFISKLKDSVVTVVSLKHYIKLKN